MFTGDIDEFVQEIKWALEGWINDHSDPEHLEYMNGGDSCIEAVAAEFVAAQMFEEQEQFICNKCYSNWPSYELGDYYKCPDCGAFCQAYDLEMCQEFVDDCWTTNEILDSLSYSDQDKVKELAVQKWYDEYFPGIPDHIAEAEAAIEDIDNATDPIELLAAVVFACHCVHVGGTIVPEHTDIDWNQIQAISEEGLEAIFELEDIEDYLGI